MHRPTHRSALLLSLLLPTALLFGGCDRGDGLESPEPLADREADAADAPEAGAAHEGARHRGPGKKVDRLCEKLECSADQRTRIEGIATRMRSERPEPAGDRDAANRGLAEAFAGGRFSSADLSAYRKAVEPDADDRDALIVEAAMELHGILDAGQRELLATKVAKHGLPFAGDKKSGKHGGKDGGKDRSRAGRDERRADDRGAGDRGAGDRRPEDRGAHMAARLCESIGCSEAQVAQVAAVLQARPERSEVPAAAREALAQAIRSEALSEGAITAYLEAVHEARATDEGAVADRVVALHGLLTAEQRATLAERVASEGPRALGVHGGHGKKGHGKKGHGKKGHGKKGHGNKRGDAVRDEAAGLG